MTTSGGSIL